MDKESREEFRRKQHFALNWSDNFFGPTSKAMVASPFTWPAWLRRLYLFTFPISLPARFIGWFVLQLIWMFAVLTCVAINWAYCMWVGIPTFWSKHG